MRPDAADEWGEGGTVVFGPDGHLDEGAAHAFVDGALADADAARVVLHLGACGRCAAAVAEARGLAAAAAGVIRRLDDGPGAVAAVPSAAVAAVARAEPRGDGPRRNSRRSTLGMPRAGVRAAAAALVVAMVGGGAYLNARDRAAPSAGVIGADSAATPAKAPAAAPATAPAAAAVPAMRPPPVATPLAPAGSTLRAEAAARRAPASPDVVRRRADPAALARGAEEAAVGVAPAPSVAAADATAPSAGVIVGRVRDAGERPLGGARVVVRGTALAATTDDSGRFVLRDVPPGSVTVQARRIGFAAGATTVAVAPADSTRAELRLGASALSLSEVVVSGAGAPPSDALGPMRADRRRRRTGGQVPPAPLGCFAASGAGLPARLELRADGAVVARGAPRGTWTFDADTLRVRWSDPPSGALALGRSGAGWAGGGARLAPSAGGGCGAP